MSAPRERAGETCPRPWERFWGLAARERPRAAFEPHWRGWLEHEADETSRRGPEPTVHG